MQNDKLKIIISQSEDGHRSMQCELAYLYWVGDGVPQNYDSAFYWFSKAAEQKWPEAQYALGKMYASGEGCAHDYVAAYQWFQKACAVIDFPEAKVEMAALIPKMTPDQPNKIQQTTKS